ncbi:hypothetical protein BD410DRAFT_900284 [Rickenella mellea]|uniref:Ubiquitin-like protease family profile domain-containing protein n=1 Tax=Rickenella mellea TaxID=50990 RepID=A0A4Y7PW17_9AGAM|nr:hypothetical protein BD410DRAFT_900284 [Rickenella mellea]
MFAVRERDIRANSRSSTQDTASSLDAQIYGPNIVVCHEPSPFKRKRHFKQSKLVSGAGHAKKRQGLMAKFQAIRRGGMHDSHDDRDDPATVEDANGNDWEDVPVSDLDHHSLPSVLDTIQHDTFPIDTSGHPVRRRTGPNAATLKTYGAWHALLPSLIQPLLDYIGITNGGQNEPPLHQTSPDCSLTDCVHVQRRILCLYWNKYQYLDFTICSSPAAVSLPARLVEHGLFPTSPVEPRVAVSIDFLEFYKKLFERSGDAITAVAAALRDFYISRGYRLVDKKGKPIDDPFRRGLGHAIQWYDCLRLRIDAVIEETLNQARVRAKTNPVSFPVPSRTAADTGNTELKVGDLRKGECHPLLQHRCPACFGGAFYGRATSQGADLHIAVDGNFHHRHRRSAGDCPEFYNPVNFVSKEDVDRVGRRILSARKRGPNRNYVPKVADIALDGCEKSFDAADEDFEKANDSRFDDTGLMAAVCRHDIPLFFANIDSPGEQQKYAIALIEKFFKLIPEFATVLVLYDIGCVLDRSLHLYPHLENGILNRLSLGTAAMHSYGHQWSCQLAYNPRLQDGYGLSDGEGVERLWSRLRKLIGITRSSARKRRIWVIDRQAAFISDVLRDDLGVWLRRRLRSGVESRAAKARAILAECGLPMTVLREQWELQRSEQTSLRAHAPARLKKELDAVLTLQTHIETVNSAVDVTQKTLLAGSAPAEAVQALTLLSEMQKRLTDQIEALFTSLNVVATFPDLRNFPLEFITALLLARDLKINIRKRAVGTFFEWDRIDQAVGGKENALGTKLHQQARKSISKRKPALMTALKKYNKYCERLRELAGPSSTFPLPQPLSLNLGILRLDDTLMQDVWIDTSVATGPRWMVDPAVRKGIRAMLELDRCVEERRRLGREADNLLRWFTDELTALEIAHRLSPDIGQTVLLRRQRESTLLLKHQWTNPFISQFRWESHQQQAADLAAYITNSETSHSFIFLQPEVNLEHIEEDFQVDNESVYDESPERDVIDDGVDRDCVDDLLDPDSGLGTTGDVAGDHQVEDSSEVLMNCDTGDVSIVVESPLVLEDLDYMDDVPAAPQPAGGRRLSVARWRRTTDGSRNIIFEPETLRRLAGPTAWLNDEVINGCSTILQSMFPRPSTVIFSTFIFPLFRTGAKTLWKHVRHACYWDNNVWIIPVHREAEYHWVIATVYIDLRVIDFFDSFGEEEGMRRDSEDIARFADHLMRLASDFGAHVEDHVDADRPWTVRSLVSEPRQHNSYECGVWVLAHVAAVLRGCSTTGLSENGIADFRQFLLNTCLALPS